MKSNRSGLFHLMLVLMIGLGLYARMGNHSKTPPPPRQPWGPTMRDLIDDPEGAEAQLEAMQRTNQADQAPLDDAGINSALEGLLSGQDYQRNVARLRAQGSRASPVLLKGLADARARHPVSSKELPGYEQIPMASMMEILGSIKEQKAVPLLLPLTHDSEKKIQEAALACLCKIGSVECVEPIKQALEGSDAEVRSRVLSDLTLSFGFSKPTSSSPLCTALFDVLLKLSQRKEKGADCFDLLFTIDAKKATQLLVNAENLNSSNSQLNTLLVALNRAQVAVPSTMIVDMIPDLKRTAETNPVESGAYGQALIALADAHYPGTEELANDALKLKSQSVRSDAAEALCIAKGLPDPTTVAYTLIEKNGIASVPPVVRQFAAVRDYIDEVNNGGLDQYFFNSSGDTSATALEGLTAMGVDDATQILRKACALFGPSGPSPNRQVRQRQLRDLVNSSKDPFSKLTSEFYKCEELETATLIFVAKNAAAFKDGGK